MSAVGSGKRASVATIRRRKGGEPLVCLTAYSAPMARLIDPHVDIALVGDSLGMTLYGFDSTLPVTLDMMIYHGAAVVRASERALVAVDMPFGSYQESPAAAFRSAAAVMAQTGCSAIKLEGGVEMAETIGFLVQRGIPVIGHVGLTPQSVHGLGGYRSRGHDEAEAAKIARDAHAVADAGAFCIVLEGMVEPLARRLTGELAIPTIGIGASPACDGQILVTEDMVGLFSDFIPKFVKRYAELGDQVAAAVAAYARDVRERSFPGEEHCYSVRTREALDP